MWRKPLADIRSQLGWRELPASQFFPSYPDPAQLSFLQPELSVVFANDHRAKDQVPAYVIAVLDPADRTTAVDLIEIRQGHRYPLVEGLYARAMDSIRPGVTVSYVYSVLGREYAQYVLKANNVWEIRLIYQGFKCQSLCIRADAATGIVTYAEYCTI